MDREDIDILVIQMRPLHDIIHSSLTRPICHSLKRIILHGANTSQGSTDIRELRQSIDPLRLTLGEQGPRSLVQLQRTERVHDEV